MPSPRPTEFPTLRTPSGAVPAGAPPWNPQRPSAMPHDRYRPVHERVPLPLQDRTWPSRRLTQAPLWVPVDLRDGNQALAEPMDITRKRRMFDLLCAMGFKEIEVGYPSASRTDFDFVRHLAETGAVPEDVTVSVFTAARHDLVDRTLASVEGLPRTLVHLYTATAPTWRDVVLGRTRDEVHALIREAATYLMRRAEERPGADIRFEFSPEVFNLTEPDFVLEVCNGLTDLWEASPDRPVVHNLPATVEVATPNVYADQIEYMDRHLARRDAVILSVHPHNDRGTGVACAELAVLAGAQRVEGCLFGNGERTGNVDLVTLALNLYAQGVDPMVDFSDIDAVREVVEDCTRLPVHPRHPYGGELVHTAFSGTHQDAISKGMDRHAERARESGVPAGRAPWDVPYLPIDPGDIGRTYEGVIRINSQSGKGGIAHLLRRHHGLDLPKPMRPDFSRTVQRVTDAEGRELRHEELWELFHRTYVAPAQDGPVVLGPWETRRTAAGVHEFTCTLVGGKGEKGEKGEEREQRLVGTGNGPLSAFVHALAVAGITVDILDYSEHATAAGPGSPAVAYAECRVDGTTCWGAGRDTSVLTASVHAVLAAVNRGLSGGEDAVSPADGAGTAAQRTAVPRAAEPRAAEPRAAEPEAAVARAADPRTGPPPAPVSGSPVLRVDGVDFVRDGKPILEEVSLTVRSGEHWALLGPNGAGKSTLLALLGALAHPTRGTVEVLGHELGRVDMRSLRARVGHVDPRHPLRSALTVRDVVLTGLTNSVERVPRWSPTSEESARAEELMSLLGVGDRREARWPVLSQGQRTRVLIARALMPSPRLLLLDEPATGLDVSGREQLLDRLDALRRGFPGLASVLVTHHLEELPAGTTHAMLLRGGRSLAAGRAEEVLTGDRVGACFDHPLVLSRADGRWSVRTGGPATR